MICDKAVFIITKRYNSGARKKRMDLTDIGRLFETRRFLGHQHLVTMLLAGIIPAEVKIRKFLLEEIRNEAE